MTSGRTAGPETEFFSRQQHFGLVGSTNDIVAAWLAEGTPEVCVATADEQTQGRGRQGRSWQAPAGAALLLSLGFRPRWLPPTRAWRIAAVVALAMADAAEEVAGLPDGAVRLKWPNDLVVEMVAPDDGSGALAARKLAGVLGESVGIGSDDPRVVVGIGINADWPRDAFPSDLAPTMTSLRDASGGRPVDRVGLLDEFLRRLEARIEGLRVGKFALSDWQERQLTTGRTVDLEMPGGGRVTVAALGVDAESGGLIVAEGTAERVVHSADVVHVRLAAASVGVGV